MNPFDENNKITINNPFNDNDNNEIETIDILIEIWVEESGRKKNTYITGWNLNDNELKEHLKIIKKKKRV
jgi:translation initiation factor 1 (eIF-1/SUI1)